MINYLLGVVYCEVVVEESRAGLRHGGVMRRRRAARSPGLDRNHLSGSWQEPLRMHRMLPLAAYLIVEHKIKVAELPPTRPHSRHIFAQPQHTCKSIMLQADLSSCGYPAKYLRSCINTQIWCVVLGVLQRWAANIDHATPGRFH